MLNLELSLTINIFIADDLTLKSKSINLDAVVKSSNIITLFSVWYIPSFSLVYPNINDLPGVTTGVSYKSSYSVDLTI